MHVSVGWPTGVATRGTSRSSSGGVLGDSRLQSLLEADLAEGGTGARAQQGSKAEQLDGLRARDEREPSLGQVQGSKADHLDGLRGRDR